MRLILLRHGQSPSNIDRLLDTSVPGPALTPLGMEQAEAVVARLQGEPVEAVYASTQLRAQQTAAPLAASLGLTVAIRDGLREISAGHLEMRADGDSHGIYVRTFLGWAGGNLRPRIPGGESGAATFARFDDVVTEAAQHDVAVLVSHGAVIRLWTGMSALDIDLGFVRDHPLSNTGVVLLEGDQAGGWKVVSWDGKPW